MKIPQYIFIHHTAVSYNQNPDQWKATDAYHKSKGWGSGGYNYEIAKNGSIHQFRLDGAETAAQYQDDMNDGRAISICLDGNFDIELPTPEQREAVSQLVQEKMISYKILPENIFCHRKVATYKSCPGTLLPDKILDYFLPNELPSSIPAWAKSSVQKALAKKIITKTDDLLTEVGTKVAEQMLVNAGIFTTKENKLTKLRFIVAMDRMGMLDT